MDPLSQSHRFPAFRSHEDARCFACGKALMSEPERSGNAPGRGEFVKRCTCGYRTWYDLVRTDVELSGARYNTSSVTAPQCGDLPRQAEYSVCQFFRDGAYEYVRRFAGAEDALRVAEQYSRSVGAQIGTTRRVIITDGGDCIVWEWKYGEGVVFPPEASAGDVARGACT